jgi:hypothetical protein
VGIGIILETPENPSRKQRVAMWLVITGIVIEPICTLVLFGFDEGISQAQQNKIFALETKLAPRTLTPARQQFFAAAVAAFKGQRYRASISQAADDGLAFWASIYAALDKADWIYLRPESFRVGSLPTGVPLTSIPGVEVKYASTRESKLLPAALALGNALHADGTVVEVISALSFVEARRSLAPSLRLRRGPGGAKIGRRPHERHARHAQQPALHRYIEADAAAVPGPGSHRLETVCRFHGARGGGPKAPAMGPIGTGCTRRRRWRSGGRWRHCCGGRALGWRGWVMDGAGRRRGRAVPDAHPRCPVRSMAEHKKYITAS